MLNSTKATYICGNGWPLIKGYSLKINNKNIINSNTPAALTNLCDRKQQLMDSTRRSLF